MSYSGPNYHQTNFALLEQYHPHIAQKLRETPPEPIGELYPSRTGLPNLLVTDKAGHTMSLHIQEDPLAEGKQFLNLVPEGSTGVIVMLGMGLGYSAIELLKNRPSVRHLFIFDLMPGIFSQALQSVDLSDLLKDPRVILCLAEDEKEINPSEVLGRAARALQLEEIHTLRHLPSLNLKQSAYQKLDSKIFDCINDFNIGGATVNHFGEKYFKNRFSNLPLLPHSFLIESLHSLFTDIPAILVAGGPSLDKNIHHLHKAKGKSVIIAVDTALPALMRHGITPDFFTSIDSQKITYEKIASAAPAIKDAYLVTQPWVTPKVPKLFPSKNIFWGMNGASMELWLNKCLGGKMLLGETGTVALLNLHLAQIMGCSPIIFVGQDLAYPETKDHASGVALSNRDKIERLLKNQQNNAITVEGFNGGKVITDRAMFNFKKQFEAMIEQSPTPASYLNATEGGVKIDGTKQTQLTEAIDSYCNHPVAIDKRIDEKTKKLDRDKLILNLLRQFRLRLKEVKQLQKTLETTNRVTAIAATEINKLQENDRGYSSIDQLPPQSRKKLAEVDKWQNKVDKPFHIWETLNEMTLAGLKESERMKHELNILKDKREQYLAWLEKHCQRLNYINDVRGNCLNLLQKNLEETISHLSQEKRILATLTKKAEEPEAQQQLVRLYCEAGQLEMAKPLLEKNLEKHAPPAEAFYYLGMLAAQQTEFDKAETLFAKAENTDPAIAPRIEAFKQQMGDEYLSYGRRYINVDKNTCRRMLLKGLRFCAGHQELATELKKLFADDLGQLEQLLEKDKTDTPDALSMAWIDALTEMPLIADLLPPDQIARLYGYRGKIMQMNNRPTEAVQQFNKSLQYAPDDPDIHIMLTDAYFATDNFDAGIAHLTAAVKKDRRYAKYWEEIGDLLRQSEAQQDAIMAYEKCFIALPEEVAVLKKIGECYLALNQPEAAHEAFKKLKEELTAKG